MSDGDAVRLTAFDQQLQLWQYDLLLQLVGQHCGTGVGV